MKRAGRSPLPWGWWFAVGLFLILIGVERESPAAPPAPKPLHFIRAIAIDPGAPETLYVATDNQGLLKSVDGGTQWTFINQGLKNYLVYDVKVLLVMPGRLWAATWGGGVYQSDDGGASWREFNDGLGNTAVGAIAVQAAAAGQQERLFVGTSTAVYERRLNEAAWRPITEGLRFWNGPQFQSLMISGADPAALYLGTERGLYVKRLGTRGWTEVPALKGKRVAVLAADPASGTFYTGTVANGGPFMSRDQGATWHPAGAGLEKAWVRALLPHPQPDTLYVGTSVEGLWKSADGGATWTAINRGLTDKEVRALAIDLTKPARLFAGTHGALFRSEDGGSTWKRIEGLPFETVDRQVAAIEAQSPRPPDAVAPPAAFAKCNQCHGWTDPALNQNSTIWRAAATRRDWRMTVARMSEGATLSREEQDQITTFLQRYTSAAAPASP